MKIQVSVNNFGLAPTKGTIIVDKEGLRFEDMTPLYDHYGDKECLIRELIRQAIDTSHWSPSWHLDISKARRRGSDERKKVRKLIDERIKGSEELIDRLKKTRIVLGRWH